MSILLPDDPLKLENQLCFPIYAVSRLITKEYQPLLSAMNLTYTQYLVLLVLWEHEKMPVNTIAQTLFLNTNTMTPLLKRMEKDAWIKRTKDPDDERKVWIELTPKSREARQDAECIPTQLIQNVLAKNKEASPLSSEDMLHLKSTLEKLLKILSA